MAKQLFPTDGAGGAQEAQEDQLDLGPEAEEIQRMLDQELRRRMEEEGGRQQKRNRPPMINLEDSPRGDERELGGENNPRRAVREEAQERANRRYHETNNARIRRETVGQVRRRLDLDGRLPQRSVFNRLGRRHAEVIPDREMPNPFNDPIEEEREGELSGEHIRGGRNAWRDEDDAWRNEKDAWRNEEDAWSYRQSSNGGRSAPRQMQYLRDRTPPRYNDEVWDQADEDDTPFARHITLTRDGSGKSLPNGLSKYSGSTDPERHVSLFGTQVMFNGLTDTMK